MPSARRSRENTVVLFVIGFLALNYPLLSLFDHTLLVLGIPLLYLYVFLSWLVVIIFTAVIVERSEPRGSERSESGSR